jgi:hypothetical protein
MAAKLTRLTNKIAIQLHLVAESCTICSSRFRRPVRKLLDTPSQMHDSRELRKLDPSVWAAQYKIICVGPSCPVYSVSFCGLVIRQYFLGWKGFTDRVWRMSTQKAYEITLLSVCPPFIFWTKWPIFTKFGRTNFLISYIPYEFIRWERP